MEPLHKVLPPPDNKIHIEFKHGMNHDIRHTLQKDLPMAITQAAPLAPYFKGSSERATAQNIWNYLRRSITYRLDPKGFQDIRLPRRFHAEKIGDCKSYSINALAIYKAIYPGLPVAFKYANYDPSINVPTHVYAVVKDRHGKNIIIDGCYNFFDSEKKPSFELPLKFDMVIRTLSDNTGMPKNFNLVFDRLPHEQQQEVKEAIAHAAQLEAIKHLHKTGKLSVNDCLQKIGELEQSISKRHKPKLSKEEKKARRKKRLKKAGLFFRSLGRGFNFITLAPIRGAFSSIIAMNVNGLASNMRLVKEGKDQTGWKKLLAFWNNVGGLTKALNKAIELGTKHKALWMGKKAHANFLARAKAAGHAETGKGAKEKWLRGLSGYDSQEFADYLIEDGIGIAPAVAAAALAMGASLLAGVIPIIAKSLKQNGHTAEAAATEGNAQDLIDDNRAGRGASSVTEEMIVAPANAPVNLNNEQPVEEEQGDPPTEDGQETTEGETVEGIGGLGDLKDNYVMFGIADDPLSDAADVLTALTPTLTTLFQTGVDQIGKAVVKAKKKHPKLKAILDQGETFADDHFTGAILHKADHPTAQDWHRHKPAGSGLTKYIPYAAGAGVVITVAYLFTRKK